MIAHGNFRPGALGRVEMKTYGSASLLAVAIASLSSPVFAQDAPVENAAGQAQVGLSDIIVTATKRSENLQEVPVAVSAISSETLQAKGVFETSDLNNTMPNFQRSEVHTSELQSLMRLSYDVFC